MVGVKSTRKDLKLSDKILRALEHGELTSSQLSERLFLPKVRVASALNVLRKKGKVEVSRVKPFFEVTQNVYRLIDGGGISND